MQFTIGCVSFSHASCPFSFWHIYEWRERLLSTSYMSLHVTTSQRPLHCPREFTCGSPLMFLNQTKAWELDQFLLNLVRLLGVPTLLYAAYQSIHPTQTNLFLGKLLLVRNVLYLCLKHTVGAQQIIVPILEPFEDLTVVVGEGIRKMKSGGKEWKSCIIGVDLVLYHFRNFFLLEGF